MADTQDTYFTKELMERYLTYMTEKGCNQGTINTYRLTLEQLDRFLPDKKITEDTGRHWSDYLAKRGYVQGTINYKTSVYNSLLEYLGHRDWQMVNLPVTENIQPELTRAEYLRLLTAAKMLEQRRTYLLIKTLGGAGIRLQELPQLTCESVRRGSVRLKSNNEQSARVLRLPSALREELLEYARSENRSTGPVFVNGSGKALDRVSIFHSIRALAKAARVDEEKASPRCLCKMYQTMREGILQNLETIADQTYERVFDKEQLTVGWDA